MNMTNHTPQAPHLEPGFFTDEEMADIYLAVNNTMDKGVKDAQDKWHYFKKNTNNGFNVIFFSERRQGELPGLSQKVEDKLRLKLEEKAKGPVGHVGVLWARYTLESGDIPTLMPHQDRSETHVAYMCTVELDSNIDWNFYVGDEEFEMKKNQAVWFSGTNQPHWRPDYDFKEGDYYDILLFQTHAEDDENPLSEDHYDEGDEIGNEYSTKYAHLLKNSIAKAQMSDGRCQ
jgi:hypothetical protein